MRVYAGGRVDEHEHPGARFEAGGAFERLGRGGAGCVRAGGFVGVQAVGHARPQQRRDPGQRECREQDTAGVAQREARETGEQRRAGRGIDRGVAGGAGRGVGWDAERRAG